MGNVHCCEKDSGLDSHQAQGDHEPLKIVNRDLPSLAAEEPKTADAPAEAAAAAPADAAAATPAAEANAAPKKDMAKKATEPVMNVPVPTGNEATNITLTLKIVSARGLRKADELTGSSDPFVKCRVKGSTRASFATKVVPENLSPIWNCSAEVSGLAVNDVLLFEVFDKDALSEDLLGRCELPVRTIQSNWKGGWSQELKLADTGKTGELTKKVSTADSWLKLEVSDIQQKDGTKPKTAKLLGVVASANAQKVMVTVVCARNLRNADFVGASDPYCVCNIPTKPDCKLQTPMMRDPPWPSLSVSCRSSA